MREGGGTAENSAEDAVRVPESDERIAGRKGWLPAEMKLEKAKRAETARKRGKSGREKDASPCTAPEFE